MESSTKMDTGSTKKYWTIDMNYQIWNMWEYDFIDHYCAFIYNSTNQKWSSFDRYSRICLYSLVQLFSYFVNLIVWKIITKLFIVSLFFEFFVEQFFSELRINLWDNEWFKFMCERKHVFFFISWKHTHNILYS